MSWRRLVTGGRLAAAVAVLSALLPGVASAVYDDEEVGGYAVVIQPRNFKLAHEFSLSGGVLPLNAYYKGAVASARYTLHFDDFQAWEIIGVSYSQNVETGLREMLFLKWQAEPESSEFDALQLIFDSNYILKPSYAKLALFNASILYAEMYYNVGGGAAKYVSSWRPVLDYGAGIRFYFLEWLSVRMEIRHYLAFNGIPFVTENATLDNLLFLSLGGSFNVGYE